MSLGRGELVFYFAWEWVHPRCTNNMCKVQDLQKKGEKSNGKKASRHCKLHEREHGPNIGKHACV